MIDIRSKNRIYEKTQRARWYLLQLVNENHLYDHTITMAEIYLEWLIWIPKTYENDVIYLWIWLKDP